VEGSQRRATSRQGMRTEVELSARHDTLISTNSKSSRELETSATSKRDENASKTRKKKPPAVAERFGPAERFVFSGRFGIDPTQYKQLHVTELGTLAREREEMGLGSWGGHGLREVTRSKPPVHVTKCVVLHAIGFVSMSCAWNCCIMQRNWLRHCCCCPGREGRPTCPL
jgi:hypothetical protein